MGPVLNSMISFMTHTNCMSFISVCSKIDTMSDKLCVEWRDQLRDSLCVYSFKTIEKVYKHVVSIMSILYLNLLTLKT